MNLPTVLLMAAAFSVVSSVKQANIMNVREWENYKSRFNKSYSISEDGERMNIYWRNRRFIDNLNELYRMGKIHYNVTDNEFADMRAAELPWKSKGCLKVNEINLALAKFWKTNDPNIFETSRNLPEDVDWVARGAVNPVKNQLDCGSCYAFATISTLESRYFIKYNKLLDLSEQNMIDCSQRYGNQGCHGGYLDNAYEYMINHGVNEQHVYPYNNREGSCRFKKQKIAATMRRYRIFTSERSLKRAVAKGPVAVGIDTHHNSFKYYSSGIYKDPKCGSYGANHAVTVVGYGTDPDTEEDYWIIRNSWGPGWGEKGYMRLLRGVQMCNIGLIAAAPIV